MRTCMRWWLLISCALVLVGCQTRSPSGKIFMSGVWDHELYVYEFGSQNTQSWGGPTYPPILDASHAWSPNYRQLAYDCYVDQKANLCLYNLDTSISEVLLANDRSYGEIYRSYMTWTPDGNGVTFVTQSRIPLIERDDRETLYTIDINTKEVTRLTDLPNAIGEITNLAWISEDELLTGFNAVHTGQILIWDAHTWVPRKVAEGLYPHWSSKTQQIVYVRDFNCLSEQACFTQLPDRNTYWRPVSSRLEIYTVDTQGKNEKLIYSAPPSSYICINSYGLTWSPDGQYLVYVGGCGGESEKSDLYVMRVADGHVEQLVEDLDFSSIILSWIPSNVR